MIDCIRVSSFLDHVYSAEPIQRTTSKEASESPESFSISATGSQLAYVGVWMEGNDHSNFLNFTLNFI